MLLACFAVLLGWQEPQPSPPRPEPAPAESADAKPRDRAAAAPPRALSDKEAKEAVAEFQKALAAGSMADKTKALDTVAASSHRLLVKPLGRVVETDKSLVVRKHAAGLLARQPSAQARPEILRLLGSARVRETPQIMAALVGALAGCDYQPGDWKVFADQFAVDYAPERVPLQEAILQLVMAQREKQALPLLIDNLDEPVPANVDDPNNPPADYWESRWKAWRVWQPRVKEAMFALTGQRFSTASEAKAWLTKNPLK